MSRIVVAVAVLTAVLNCTAGNATAQLVMSNFDQNANGWSGTGPANQYTWTASGGNPTTGGYISFTDMEGNAHGTITAPTTYITALPSANGGTLAWDSKIFSISGSGSDPGSSFFPFTATIVGGTHASTATFTTTTNDSVISSWVTTVAPLNAADWTITGVDSWANILANPTSLSIEIERVSNTFGPTMTMPGDTDGIDNVILTAVPEPGSLILSGIGLAFVVTRCRGRRAERNQKDTAG